MQDLTASDVFGFLERCSELSIEKHVIASSEFSALRHSMRQMIFMLRDFDEEEAIFATAGLSQALSEWLTTPIPFNESMHDVLVESLGNRIGIGTRWGSDIAEKYEAAWESVEALSLSESPLRAALLDLIKELRGKSLIFRIYCHRRAREYFESIVDLAHEPPLQPENFLHTSTGYENAVPSDAVIKVGPLRAAGWGRVPDAFINAPRFSTIYQFVWPGCEDDENFGFDAATGKLPSRVENSIELAYLLNEKKNLVWHVKRPETAYTRKGVPNTASTNSEDLDDLLLFREVYKQPDTRSSVLVQLDEQFGILYPRFSSVLSYDPHPGKGFSLEGRSASEGLQEGMFVVFPSIYDVDLGEQKAEHGYFSRIWKERLADMWNANPEELIRQLQAKGLNLVHLNSAIRNWLKSPDTVIHAPQSIKHFRILLEVLNIDQNTDYSRLQVVSRDFWEEAWLEIRRSRGEAIQAGFQEQEIVEEQIIQALRSALPEIEEQAAFNDRFTLNVPEGFGIDGYIQFCKIQAIEDGYSAPHAELKIKRDLKRLDKWRA